MESVKDWWSGAGDRAKLVVKVVSAFGITFGALGTTKATWVAFSWPWFASDAYVDREIRSVRDQVVDLQIDENNRKTEAAWRAKTQWDAEARSTTDPDARARFEANSWQEGRTVSALEDQLRALKARKSGPH